ncbi:MAG: 50S ribosomal protein L13 [Patescibacteria group bacterium]|jgi:large subunit ribosomal protein L13|nr:50S ribosomal protein L13 [Patescibacteria group bacterium]MDD5173059.1 50S ribosomal protein L13 [Patescibacteria group bacterium]
MIKIERKTYNIDATDKVLGRLASQIAQLLIGKGKVEYRPNVDNGDIIIVKNVDKIKITGQKLKQKIYYHHSQYPGGLKKKKMEEVFLKKPMDVLKKAVWNMLPKNKLRQPRIKRLSFK